MNTSDNPLEQGRPYQGPPIDTSNREPRTTPFNPTHLNATTEDLMTVSTDQQTAPAPVRAPDLTEEAPPGRVVLHLIDRSVSFTGTQVSTVPSFSGTTTDDWPVVYLTANDNIAVHDPAGRTLTVRTLEEFVTSFADTPVSWIVDEVLAKLPRAVEQLDI